MESSRGSNASQQQTALNPKPSRRKVKTGCLTCKKRRVKCDEGRPACERCVSTGRVCDGYGIWGGGGTGYGNNSKRTAISAHQVRRQTVSNVIVVSHLRGIAGKPQGIGYEYFRNYTITKLPGAFESGFWESLVFQACAQDPAVLHAVTALGAAHKNEERLALVEYNKAISHLRRHLCRSDKEALQVSLITCMVFVCIELLWGGFKTGHAHLNNGLQLLREIQAKEGITSSNGPIILRRHPQSVEDTLAEVFSRLNVQAALFGQVSTYLIFVGENAKAGMCYDIPSRFTSFCDARAYLDALINGVYNLTQEGSHLTQSQKRIPKRLLQSRQHIEDALAKWIQALGASEKCLMAYTTIRTVFCVPILRMYYTMTKIMVKTALRGTDEMVYDAQNLEFASILRQAADLWDMMHHTVTKLQDETGNHMPEINFTADMGFIPPLYYTVVKCRQPNYRRMAVELLKSAPHREGAWDGPLVARMACNTIGLEEGDFYKDFDLEPCYDILEASNASATPELPVLPRSARFNSINVALPDHVGREATLFCKQYRDDGVWVTKKFHFDMTFDPHVACRMWDCKTDSFFTKSWQHAD